jgi:hypothetical protein
MPYTEALAKLTDIVSGLSLKVSDTFALLRKAGQGAIVDIALHNNDHEAHAADKVTDASVRNFSSADLLVTPRALGLAFNAKYNAANGLDEDLND